MVNTPHIIFFQSEVDKSKSAMSRNDRPMSGVEASLWRPTKAPEDAHGAAQDQTSPKRNSKPKRKKPVSGLASSPTRLTTTSSSQASSAAAKGLPLVKIC